MLVHAVVSPQPPLLVPALAPGAGPEVLLLRKACADIVTGLTAAGCDQIVVVAGADTAGAWDQRTGGTLAAYGVDVEYGGGVLALPLSLTLGAFLLDQAGWAGPRCYVAVASGSSTNDCILLGREMAGLPDRTGLLVLGDGSAKRSSSAPGYLDARAVDFDGALSRAFGTGDSEALLGIDPDLADVLWCAGRAAWQVLASAAQASVREGATVTAQLRYDDAPLGVAYLVADWRFVT